MTDHDTGRPWRRLPHLAVAAALCLVAVVLRAGPLGPSSLWLDDAWVALVSKTNGMSDTFMVGLTGPGFAFVLKGWLALVGFSETAAQLPAVAFGALAPGLLYLAAVDRGLPAAGALAAGGLLAASPVHIVYSTRVKHYTLDTLLAVVLIGLAWAVVQQPTRGRWVWLVVVACAAVAMSGGVAPVAAAALGTAALAALPRGREAIVTAAAACGIWLGFAAAWYLAVLAPAVTPSIRGYWAGAYVDSAAELLRGWARVADGFSALPPAVVALLLAAGVAALAVRRRTELVLLVLGPVAVVTVLAALGLAPLGGGRTDAVLYPGLALGIGASALWLPRASGWVAGTAAAALVAVAVVLAGPAPPYPQEDVRPLVAHLERMRRPGEPVVVYPSSMWGYALYTSQPIGIRRDSDNPWGFRPEVNHAAVTLLEASRDDPARYAPAVSAAAEGADRLWLLASHRRPDLDAIKDALRDAGMTLEQDIRRNDAELQAWR